MIDDLISREAAIETVKKLLYETALNSCGHHQDDEIYADIAEHRIEVWLGLVPTVPAVPLDKLCEWLSENSINIPCEACQNFSNEYCTAIGDASKPCPKTANDWREAITKWMEEQDD